MDPSKYVTPEAVGQYGPLTIVFVVVLGLILHWYFKRYPEERDAQHTRDQMMFEQVALSRQALETSNMVIQQNSEHLKDSTHSHQRLGERFECVEGTLDRHDRRAEQIAQDLTAIKTKLEA